MRYLLIFILLSFEASGQELRNSQLLNLSLDSSVLLQLKKAKVQNKKDFPFTESFWFLSNKQDLIENIDSSNLRNFIDTISSYSGAVCACMIKKDTIYIRGGLAYGGGFGYNIKIIKGQFLGNLWVSGKERYKLLDSDKYTDELYLSGNYQTLKLQSQKQYRVGSNIGGVYVIESEDYFDKNTEGSTRLYLKLLFNCKLGDYIAF
jgi:hypothetical protein